ncbi:hypothetical protein DR996_24435 [Vibrio owensii]|nr:hypothetical protein DR996_24375 [Vibrio owensii]QLK48141.1 hypothetical protein DR996_24435 [Vibrio owensii]
MELCWFDNTDIKWSNKEIQLKNILLKTRKIASIILNKLNLIKKTNIDRYYINDLSNHVRKDIGVQSYEEKSSHYSNYL